MRKTRVCLTLGCLLFTLASCTWAQGGRKPGLWEVTSTMTFQQSPFPAGMQAPGGSPFSGAPKTTQVCVTQAMIDKYGGPPPQTRGDCQMSNVATTLTGMTGTLTCTGAMSGTATVNATWSDSGTSQTKVHFTGSMKMGPQSTPVEWTMQATSTYKSSDCGGAKPVVVQ